MYFLYVPQIPLVALFLLASSTCVLGSLIAPPPAYVNTVPFAVPPYSTRVDLVTRGLKSPFLPAPFLPPPAPLFPAAAPFYPPSAFPSRFLPSPFTPSPLFPPSPYLPSFYDGAPAPFPTGPFNGPFTIPGPFGYPPFFYRR